MSRDYRLFDEEILWDIVESRVADLLERVRRILDAESEDGGGTG